MRPGWASAPPRSLSPSRGLLLLVGAYVAYYRWYEIRVQRAAATQDPLIDTAGTIQRTVADALDATGPAACLPRNQPHPHPQAA